MKEIRAIPLWAVVVASLCLVDLCWHGWNWLTPATYNVEGRRFRPGPWHNEDRQGFGILDSSSGKPLWVQWQGTPHKESYYFDGERVLDVWPMEHRSPTYGVSFHGPGKSVTYWLNRDGAPTFNERAYYNTNGILSRDEILYDGSWYEVDRRSGYNGVLVAGQWRRLAFDTNGMWILIEDTAAVPSGKRKS